MSPKHRILKSFNIASWNANSLTNKKHELEDFLINFDIDIMLINETWLRQGNIFKIANYYTYRDDRQNRPGGGTAILIKNNIKHDILYSPETENLETTSIQIYIDGLAPTKIIAAYLPPNKSFVAEEFNKLLNSNSPFILMGDLNSKNRNWGCRSNNKKGNELYDYTTNKGFNILAPNEPTFYGTSGPADILDIGIISNIPKNVHISTVTELSSDHNPIILEVGEFNEPPITFHKQKIDWDKFKTICSSSIKLTTKLKCSEDIDLEIENFTGKITNALETSSTTINCNNPYTRNSLPPNLKQLIKTKNKAKKRAQLTMSPLDKAEANRLTTLVKNEIYNYKNSIWNTTLENTSTQDNSLYHITKSLKCRKENNQFPPIHGENGLKFTDDEKCETFADSLEKQFCENETIDWEFEEIVEDSVAQILQSPTHSPALYTSSQEIMRIIKNLSSKKAPGPDNIKNAVIKKLPNKCIGILTSIINACLRQFYFPTYWKRAIVILIHKTGSDKTFPENYRPISLLSCIGKIYEAIILNEINYVVDVNNLLPNEQFGFRASHSTTLQATRVVEDISKGFSNKEMSGAVLLDIQKAFDKVWHNALIFKLHKMSFPSNLILLINSFLENRKFRVSINKEYSSWRQIKAGVPQGSLLSPILFNLFTADIPVPESNNIASYADDVMIYTTSRSPRLIRSRLNNALKIIVEWYEKWKIKINCKKTQAILFTRKRIIPDTGPIFINNTAIEWSEVVKYLGVFLDRKLLFKTHIERTLVKANTAKSQVFCLICKNSKMNIKNKLLIYKLYIRPILLYASPTWCIASKTNLNKLQTFQNKILRLILNAPWFIRNIQIHNDLQIKTIKEEITCHTQKLYEKSTNHINPLVTNSLSYEINPLSHLRRQRNFIQQQ